VLSQLENMFARIHAIGPKTLLGGGMSGLKI
jgi:hypothetical protein